MYLLINQVLSGPFADAQVKRRYRRGELDGRIMSWCEGEGGWMSLAGRWPAPGANARCWTIRVAATVFVLMAVGLAIKLPGGWFTSWLPLPLQRGELLWVLVTGCSLVAASALLVLARTFRGRGIGAFPAVLTVGAACGVAFAMGSAGVDYRVLRKRHRTPNAVVSFDKAAAVLRIKGTLGARLPLQVSAMLKRHPDARGVMLDSPGGLVAPAFAVVRILKKRDLSATVDGMCASACVAIWAGAPQRRMTPTSRIGLHQLRMGIEMPHAIARRATRAPSHRYDRILASAGFGKALIARQKGTPPDDIYWVHAPELAAAGVALDIVDTHGQPVSLAQTKWRLIERAIGEHHILGRLMRAVRRHEPGLVPELAPTFYKAAGHDQNRALAGKAGAMLGRRSRVVAVTYAADADVVAWMERKTRLVSRAHARGDADACAMVMGMSLSGKRDSPSHDAVMQRVAQSTITLIRAVPLAPDGKRPPPAALTGVNRRDMSHAARAAYRDMRHPGASADTDDWSVLQQCGLVSAFNKQVLALEQHRAAQAIRMVEGVYE